MKWIDILESEMETYPNETNLTEVVLFNHIWSGVQFFTIGDQDVQFSVYTFIFVLCYSSFHLRNPFLALLGMIQILMNIPIA